MNNTQLDNTQDIDVLIPMYDLKECSDNHSKTLRSFSQYYRNELTLTAASAIDEFPCKSVSFKLKEKITGKQVTIA